MALVIPAVTRLSDRVIRILGCNPGPTTLQGTNSYLIGIGKRRILIDTSESGVPQYINYLHNVLKFEKVDLAHILLSHGADDHAGGAKDVVEELTDYAEYCQIWKYPSKSDDRGLPEYENLKDGQEFTVEGATIRVIHTPGTSKDHVSFYLVEENAIFSGECILGEGTTAFEDLNDYIESLQVLGSLQSRIIYPGHGNVINDTQEKIAYYLAHRIEREQKIVEVLRRNRKQSYTEHEIVNMVYEGLPQTMVKVAEYNICHHLDKLLKESKVRKIDEMWQFNESAATKCIA